MKISNIYIRGLQQFQNVDLDFTNPKTGEPLQKICFIGRNGTGKSKLLLLIQWFLVNGLRAFGSGRSAKFLPDEGNGRVLIKFHHNKAVFFAIYVQSEIHIFDAKKVQDEHAFIEGILNANFNALPILFVNLTEGMRHKDFVNELVLKDNSSDLIIYSPAEAHNNNYGSIEDVPKVRLNEALELFSNFRAYHVVSQETLNEFWKVIIYNIKKLDEAREKYETSAENINKTKAQLIEEFNRIYPTVLDSLARIWNKILNKAGLEFDIEGAKKPIQLSDTFKAYIRLKTSKQVVAYNALSTGIRNFIFRLGHIYSLYFNREIERGFLFVDEPENSLFPDFLFDLVETYQEVIIDKREQNNTQVFFATHNPIIAAQFECYERIILDWSENGGVIAKRGLSPVGDDPNDVLTNDFELTDLMGPEGRKMWDLYENLKKKLIRAKSNKEKEELIEEINEIGSRYNFS